MNKLRTMDGLNMMYKRLLCLLFLLTVSVAWAEEDTLPSIITMYQGESSVLNGANIARFSVGMPDMVSTTLLKNGEIVLTAESIGETNMQVWFADGHRESMTVVVVASDGWREMNEIKSLLGDIAGINIRSIGRRVFIEGTVAERDLERIEMVKAQYENMIVLAQSVSEYAQKMIYFDVQITEFDKSSVESIGVNWDTSIVGPSAALLNVRNSGDVVPAALGTFDNSQDPFGDYVGGSGSNGVFFGIATEITSRLNFLEKTGSAIIMASPRLSSRSGGTASLQVGGQVPVVSSSINGQTVEYKDYGISLDIEPSLDPYGNIISRISTTISQIDTANSTEDYPAFLTREVENDVILKTGETLVLSGLISKDQAYTSSGIKWLQDIPVLGALFRSKGFDSGMTELVIFVTPTVMEDLTKGVNKEQIERADQLVKAFEEHSGQGLLD